MDRLLRKYFDADKIGLIMIYDICVQGTLEFSEIDSK